VHNKSLLIFTLLTACTSPAEQDWASRYTPYGRWKSDRGFIIDIARNGTYEVCDGTYYSVGRHTGQDRQLTLHNFRHLKATQRLQQLDVIGLCGDDSCNGPASPNKDPDTFRWFDDIYFYHNVANGYHRQQCGGDRDCVILGNVETAEGMFYKISK